MALQLKILDTRITAAATLTITCDSSASPDALKQTLWGVGDLKELCVHRRALGLIDVVATYAEEALAEDAKALLQTFVPKPQDSPPTPLSDEIAGDEGFELLTVIRNANNRNAVCLECQCTDLPGLLETMIEFGETKPSWRVEGQKKSLRLEVEYLAPADYRQAYNYWGAKLSTNRRPSKLLQGGASTTVVNPDKPFSQDRALRCLKKNKASTYADCIFLSLMNKGLKK